jgi:ribonuclease P protein component
MLPKSRRIPRKLFKTLLESQKYSNSPHFSLRVAPSGEPRVAVSVSKKISKKATIRNTIRRRVYSSLQQLFPTLKNNLFLIIAKVGADKMKGEALKSELAELIKKG